MKPKAALRRFLLLAGSSLLAISSAHADQIWDGGDIDDNFWNSADNWGADTLPTFGSTITFAGNTRNGAVNDLAAATTIGGINFTNDGSVGKTNAFTLSGNQITLGGNITTTAITTGPTITDVISLDMAMNTGGKTAITGLGHDLTISGVISGTVQFLKDGAGTLTLSGANTFSNNFVVTAGTVNANTILSSGVGNNQSLGTSQNIMFGSTNGESVVNYTGGATSITTKFLVLGSGTGAGVAGGQFEGLVGRLNNNGTGAMVFNSGNLNAIYTGVLTTTARTLVLGGANTDANTVGILRDNVTPGAGGNATVNFRKEDAGTWIFRSANTYTGTTTVNGGLLTLNASGTINNSSGITLSGGKLFLDNTVTNNATRIANNVTLSQGGELSLSGNAAGTSESFGTLGIAAGDSTVTVKGVTAASTLAASDFSRTANGTALIRGSSLGQGSTSLGRITLGSTAGLSFVGTTTLNNNASGNTTKNVRIVPYLVGGTTDSAVASTFITYDTTLGFRALEAGNFNTTLTTATNVRLTANTVASSSVAINSLIVANTSATALTINDGQTLTVSSGAILFTNSATIKPSSSTGILAFGAAEGVVTVNSGLTGTISAVVNGSGGLTKSGAGTLALGGNNTYTGATAINAGKLTLSGSGTLGSGSYAGAISLGNGATLQKDSAASQTLSGNITGLGGVVMNASTGTLVLEGTNTYTGATLVSAGTLLVSGSLVSDVTVSDAATIGGGGTVDSLILGSTSLFDMFEAITNSNSLNATVISFAATGFGIDNLVYNGAAVNWGTIANGTYTLITGTLDETNLGNFGSANAFDLGGGRSVYFQEGSLQLVVIPEPGTALLGGLGFLLMLRRRRA